MKQPDIPEEANQKNSYKEAEYVKAEEKYSPPAKQCYSKANENIEPTNNNTTSSQKTCRLISNYGNPCNHAGCS